MSLEHRPVESSNIASEGYDPDTLTLELTFKSGQTYRYVGVTPERYQAFRGAESKGKHFHQYIKGKYETSWRVDQTWHVIEPVDKKVDTAK